MKNSIYSSRSQILNEKFEAVKDLSQLMIVGIDYAKAEHTVIVASGNGEHLQRKPLRIFNTSKGFDFLLQKIEKLTTKYKILKNNIIIAIEDPPPYLVNFLYKLQKNGYYIVKVNPGEAKKFRNNSRASSDTIDANGIVQAVINRKGYDWEQDNAIYDALKNFSRQRENAVIEKSKLKNKIHNSINILFPHYTTFYKSFDPFSAFSIELLKKDFSVEKIKKMRLKMIEKKMQKYGIPSYKEKAKQLKELAEHTLSPPPEIVFNKSKELSCFINSFLTVENNIKEYENLLAINLVQTEGFYLTSIPAIGIVRAASLLGEYGAPHKWKDADKIMSYAGLACRENQTGGSNKPAIKLGLPWDANKHLKNTLLQTAYGLGLYKHPAGKIHPCFEEHRLYKKYHQIKNNGGCPGLRTAKLLVKIIIQMFKSETVYAYEGSDFELEEKMAYYTAVDEMLNNKWRKYDLSNIPDDKKYTVKWKAKLVELKSIATIVHNAFNSKK